MVREKDKSSCAERIVRDFEAMAESSDISIPLSDIHYKWA